MFRELKARLLGVVFDKVIVDLCQFFRGGGAFSRILTASGMDAQQLD